jgi:hypothetical protein
MRNRLFKYGAAASVGVGSFLIAALPAMAAPDTTLSNQTSTLQTYFTDNLPTIIGLVIGVGAVLWLLAMAFRSIGFKGKNKAVGS